MDPPAGDTTQQVPELLRSMSISTKSLAQSALEANQRLQRTLTVRAEKLEAELSELDKLLAAATVEESQDEPESEVAIPGAKKAVGLFPASEFLNPAVKPKDLEILANAVRQENERLSAYARILPTSSNFGQGNPIDLDKNTDGLDWKRIAEKVSDASSVKRNATECQIAWVADKHPNVNHSEWSSDEIDKLNNLISECTREKKAINWVNIAEKLGTHRVPIDCMRHGIPRHRHAWSPETDEKLIQAVAACGVDNWQLVARTVSEHVSAGQCQNRWQKSLCPTMRKGAWTEEEDDRLRKAVAGYGVSWMQVATAIPGRTNDQCRERWTQYVNVAAGKIVWTDEEDQTLLDSVKELGNVWKAISIKLGGNKTGQSCRMRYDKLIRNQKVANKLGPTAASASTTPAPDAAILEPSILEFSIHNSAQPIGETSSPSGKKRKGKGKSKATAQPEAAGDVRTDDHAVSGTSGPQASASSGVLPTYEEHVQTSSTSASAQIILPKIKPKPKPRPRTAKKPVADGSPVDPSLISTPPPVDRERPPEMPTEIEGATVEPFREVPVISSNPKRGRKRKVPAPDSDLVDQQVDIISKPPQKKVKFRKGASGFAMPVLSAPAAGDNMGMEEGEFDAGTGNDPAHDNGPSSMPTPVSDRMDIDGPEDEHAQTHDTTPKPRKRGRPRRAEFEATQNITETSPSTRRSARLRNK